MKITLVIVGTAAATAIAFVGLVAATAYYAYKLDLDDEPTHS